MTIKEIAALAGVSASTVSKIINNKDDNINIETRNRVLKIVKDYNYTPYASALMTCSTKTFLLGVLMKDSTQAFLMTQGILEAAQKNGYRIIFCNSADNLEEEYKHLLAFKAARIDGLIWDPVSRDSLSKLSVFDNTEFPIQLINSSADSDSLSIDFAKLGREATQVLIDNGHTRPACMLQSGQLRSLAVMEGFKRCLYDNHIPFDDHMILFTDAAESASRIHAHQFTGVVSSHFSAALALFHEFEKLQYHIPNDLSLISLRDDARESIFYPPITCLKIPNYQFGFYLGEKIIHLCEKKTEAFPAFETSCLLENRFSIDIPFTSRIPKIIVIGSINIDVTLTVEDLPQPGQTIETSHSSIAAGGKGINQSIGVSKLNCPVSLIGKVGNNYETAIIYESLAEHHVDSSGVERDITIETGQAYIHVQSDGESTISIQPGANSKLSPKDIRGLSRLFKNTSFCLLQTEIPLDTVIEAAQMAAAQGIRTILKPAALKSISTELMSHIDYFIPNKKEATLLCPNQDSLEEMADFFLSLGARNVIITLGHAGCYVKNATESFSVSAIAFTPIDTTGGADAFISALSVYLSSGYPLQKAVKIATYAAAFCINRQGVVSALIDRNSLEIYIRKTEPGLL